MNSSRLWTWVVIESLALICCQVSLLSAEQPKVQYAAVLEVKHTCCAKESAPAIKELSKLPGVGRVSVDYKKRTLLIEPTNVAPSPRALWEAAERVKVGPMRLSNASGVFTSKPQR